MGLLMGNARPWARGRQLMISRMNEASLPIDVFIKSASASAARVPGTAVFMTTSMTGVPHALLHNLKHNKVLHERVMLLTVRIKDVPFVPEADRIETKDYSKGFFRVILRYGFMEEIDVPSALSALEACGGQCRMMDTQEAMKHLSRIRLGIDRGYFKSIDHEKLNELIIRIQPAHLELQMQGESGNEARDIARASLLRNFFHLPGSDN